MADIEGCELPQHGLRRRLGGVDRSNLRRAVRGLIQRGFIEDTGDPSRVALTMRGVVAAHCLNEPPDPVAESRRRWSAVWNAFIEAKHEEKRRREAKIAANRRWLRYESRTERDVMHGPNQRRVLASLWHFADPPDAGLPVEVVKALAGGEKSNVRRAIRTLLLERGEVEETPEGDRIRLAEETLLFYRRTLVPGGELVLERFDGEFVEAVLEEFGEDVRVRDWEENVVV